MDKDSSLKVRELLEKGLYHYGLGEVSVAVDLWKQALEIDPDNELVREYLEIEIGSSAAAKDKPKPVQPEREAHKTPGFTEAQMLIHEGKASQAAESFARAYADSGGQLYIWSYVELAKTSLVKRFMADVESLQHTPQLTRRISEISRMNLSEEQGFILSLITGDTSFEDIIALSPVPKYKTYLTLYGFLEDEIIRIKK